MSFEEYLKFEIFISKQNIFDFLKYFLNAAAEALNKNQFQYIISLSLK